MTFGFYDGQPCYDTVRDRMVAIAAKQVSPIQQHDAGESEEVICAPAARECVRCPVFRNESGGWLKSLTSKDPLFGAGWTKHSLTPGVFRGSTARRL